MNQVLQWLSGGDLRSDGVSNEVVKFVLANRGVFADLYEGLSAPDDVVRGRTADALEKIARSQPEWVENHIPALVKVARRDEVPMVRFHLAMTLGHLAIYQDHIDEISQALLDLLQDDSVFVKSWAIASLCIVGRLYPDKRETIVQRISALQSDNSPAVRTRVRKALPVLTNEMAVFPKGWIKSQRVLDSLA
ncbi:MAG: HEAT repeat domain-containing protein [Anaerolineales bacterium]|jgi:HEAT repeat protein